MKNSPYLDREPRAYEVAALERTAADLRRAATLLAITLRALEHLRQGADR